MKMFFLLLKMSTKYIVDIECLPNILFVPIGQQGQPGPPGSPGPVNLNVTYENVGCLQDVSSQTNCVIQPTDNPTKPENIVLRTIGNYDEYIHGNFVRDDTITEIKGYPRGSGAVDLSVERGNCSQVASGDFSVISGGQSNISSGFNSVVSGGRGNNASGNNSIIGGGLLNIASGDMSVVSGGGPDIDTGIQNQAPGYQSVVSGGGGNQANGNNSVVSGGKVNTASGINSVVTGGNNNTASGNNSVICGGLFNFANNSSAIICGGNNNIASGIRSTIINGFQNQVTETQCTIVSGQFNKGNSSNGIIGGGINNQINGLGGNAIVTGVNNMIGNINQNITVDNPSFIGAGENNLIYGSYSGILAGTGNEIYFPPNIVSLQGPASDSYSFIGGGQNNKIWSQDSVICGGNNNRIGNSNILSPPFAQRNVICGGSFNSISSTTNIQHNFIGSGNFNDISGANFASIVGGQYLRVNQDNSTAIGKYNTAGNISITNASGFISGSTGINNIITTNSPRLFMIGNGNGDSAINRNNAFCVTESGYAIAENGFAASTSADFAEYFESRYMVNGIPTKIPIGTSVVFDHDGFIMPSNTPGLEDKNVIGVISTSPCLSANGALEEWQGKYEIKYGLPVYEEKEVKEEILKYQDIEITDSGIKKITPVYKYFNVINASGDIIGIEKIHEKEEVNVYEKEFLYVDISEVVTKRVVNIDTNTIQILEETTTKKVPDMQDFEVVDSSGVVIDKFQRQKFIQKEPKKVLQKKLNSNYVPSQNYIPRPDRPEWNLVGLVGQIYILNDQKVNPNWIKMKQLDENMSYWFIK